MFRFFGFKISKPRSIRISSYFFLCFLFPVILSAQWLETTIYIPDSITGLRYPQAFAYNETDNKIYVGGQSGNCLIVIDGATDTVIATVQVRNYPIVLTYNSTNNKVFCANAYSFNVIVIDGVTDSVWNRSQKVPRR